VTPPTLDAEVVGRRLRLISATLADLELLRGVDSRRLEAEPLTRAAAERLLQVLVDLAVDVNAHVAVAVSGSAPSTGHESFLAMARVGALDADLANQLAPAAGLRNVLVHRYAEIRTELVSAAIDEVLDHFPEYVRQMARFVMKVDRGDSPEAGHRA